MEKYELTKLDKFDVAIVKIQKEIDALKARLEKIKISVK